MSDQSFSGSRLNGMVLFRLLIGWHFMYEGVVKLYNPGWTSGGYLASSEGWFRPLFLWLSSEGIVAGVDFINIAGLLIVGLTLLFGIWERIGAVTGILLLTMYYLSHPPFPGVSDIGTEGSYFIVNKNMIEAVGLWILYMFPSGDFFGVKRLLNRG